MQIIGTITVVGPVDYTDPQHGNKYQNITITAFDGTIHAGRIASKKGYSGGESIMVVSEEKARNDGSTWTQFKRIDPQQGQQNAPQAPQQPPQATKPPPQQRNSREVSIERQASLKAACEYAGRIGVDGETMIKIAIAGHHFVETGENAYLKIQNPETLKYSGNQQLRHQTEPDAPEPGEGDQAPF